VLGYLSHTLALTPRRLFNVNISIEKCSKIVNFEAYSLAAVLCITSSIMLLRAHALWDQRRWVGALCVLVVATEVTVLFYLASFGEGACTLSS
jgi:uncharacterized membrane protein YqjE